MIEVPETVIERVASAVGKGQALTDLAEIAVDRVDCEGVGAVIAATFSNPRRFPSLAVKIAARLNLPTMTPAFDLQLACSAYPYAVYLASKIAADTKKKVLVVDGDVQSRLVDEGDHATGAIFSDAVTASIVGVGGGDGRSRFDFFSQYDEALECGETGPIRMDGFKVFSFVASEVVAFLKGFGGDYDYFVPHQANPYMIRQLARSLGAEEKLVTMDASLKNPGSCSVAMTLEKGGKSGRMLIAGFGAGYSASAGIVRYAGA